MPTPTTQEGEPNLLRAYETLRVGRRHEDICQRCASMAPTPPRSAQDAREPDPAPEASGSSGARPESLQARLRHEAELSLLVRIRPGDGSEVERVSALVLAHLMGERAQLFRDAADAIDRYEAQGPRQ